jgi:hypothetical protein
MIRGAMSHPFWFGVTYTFSCPLCHKMSIEEAGVNFPTDEVGKLSQRIDYESLNCQHCRNPLQTGVHVAVDIRSGTRESLMADGFPFPPDAA